MVFQRNINENCYRLTKDQGWQENPQKTHRKCKIFQGIEETELCDIDYPKECKQCLQSEAKVVKILFKIQKERGGQVMELLKERIRKDGVVKEGNVLKVDRFLNHQMDVKLFREIGKEF